MGAADGSTAILQLCDGLADLQPNEKATFSAVRDAPACLRKLGPATCCALPEPPWLHGPPLAPVLPAPLVPAPRRALHACAQIVERETSREKNLEKAQKEAKVRARREAARAAEGAAPEAGAGAGDADALLQARPPLAARCPGCCTDRDRLRLNTSSAWASAWAQSCLAQKQCTCASYLICRHAGSLGLGPCNPMCS